MYCMFEEYNCLEFPTPTPSNNATCREPLDSVVNGVNHEYAEGSWYVTYGFNEDYDCFDCQILSFDFPRNQPVYYEALYDLIAVNGTLIWDDVVMHGSEETPGVITLTGHDGGLTDVQRWFFLINEEDTMLVYYCGSLMTWHFEGVLLMSKTKDLNPLMYPLVTEKLEALDLTWQDLCHLDPYDHCDNPPNHHMY